MLMIMLPLTVPAQQKWRMGDIGIQSGLSAINKKISSTGWVMQWDVTVLKGKHLFGVEYETATNMRIDALEYAVDQINLLYGRDILKPEQKFRLQAFAGSGFYRQSDKRLHTDDEWKSETAIGLKLKLKAFYPLYKQWQLSINPNMNFNFSNTSFSVLAGVAYRFR